MKHITPLAIISSLLISGTAQAKWSRIPILKEKPVNVAVQGPHSGASIDSSAGVGQVDNLLNEADVTAAATLGAGKAFFIVNFGKPLMISSSALVNDGIEGKISLSASADKNGWAVLEEKVVSAADREINFKFAGIQAKFLKYDFILSKGGALRALNVLGGQTDRGYALKQDPTGLKGTPMNIISGLGGARLVYAAPRPVGGYDTAATYNKFEFPESDEKYRTLIYDMGQMRIMNEFGSVHSPTPVRFEVFAFDKLPEKEDWRGRVTFDPADFNVAKPVATAEDNVGRGYVRAKPSHPIKTRYVAMRWEPDFNPPAFIIDNVGGTGNVNFVQGSQTRTVTINGQVFQVVVDVGDAHGAGSSAGNGTTTITPLDASGNPSGPSQVFNGTDVTINPGGVVIQTTDPTTGQPQTVATSGTDPNGNVTFTAPPGGDTPPSNNPQGGNTNTSTNSDGNLGAGSSPAPNSGGSQGSTGNQITTGFTSP